MKKFAAQAIFLILLIFGALVLFSPTGKSQIDLPFLPRTVVTSNLEINGAVLKVEIADTESKRNTGLGGKDSLGQDEGMLFVFPKSDKYAFWMKGLKFPLDFVWIMDNSVVDLLVNIQPPKPGDKDEFLPIYSSKVEFNKVLEVNAGTIGRLNIKVGDTLKIQ